MLLQHGRFLTPDSTFLADILASTSTSNVGVVLVGLEASFKDLYSLGLVRITFRVIGCGRGSVFTYLSQDIVAEGGGIR